METAEEWHRRSRSEIIALLSQTSHLLGDLSQQVTWLLDPAFSDARPWRWTHDDQSTPDALIHHCIRTVVWDQPCRKAGRLHQGSQWYTQDDALTVWVVSRIHRRSTALTDLLYWVTDVTQPAPHSLYESFIDLSLQGTPAEWMATRIRHLITAHPVPLSEASRWATTIRTPHRSRHR